MKAYRKNTKFEPVILELESQEEVDVLFAIANYVPIMRALEDVFDIAVIKNILRPFMSDYLKYHMTLSAGGPCK